MKPEPLKPRNKYDVYAHRVSGDPAARGLCPWYNSYDGSCMRDEKLTECASHLPNWTRNFCPLLKEDKP